MKKHSTIWEDINNISKWDELHSQIKKMDFSSSKTTCCPPAHGHRKMSIYNITPDGKRIIDCQQCILCTRIVDLRIRDISNIDDYKYYQKDTALNEEDAIKELNLYKELMEKQFNVRI